MISVEDRGSTRSGRTYLPEYLDRVPTQRREEIIENLLKSKRVDVDNLSDIMEIMSINRTTATIPEKALKEYSAPTLHYLKEPILFPNPGVREYQFDGELINILQEKAFSGREDEDPGRHLREFEDVIASIGPKGISRDFSRLKLFRCRLSRFHRHWKALGELR